MTAKLRDCLRCGNEFPSKGAENRICETCTAINKRVYAKAPNRQAGPIRKSQGYSRDGDAR